MQTFTPTAPALNSLAVSQIVRDNANSLLSSQSGPSLPAYAVEGMFWFDDVNKNMKVTKARGSKAFTGTPMGAVITLGVALVGAGLDGSTITASIRIQDSTLLVTDKDWSLVGPNLSLYFSTTKNPSYFAAKVWADPVIGEPVLYTADGALLGKTWESLAPLSHETIYASGTLSNEVGFAASTLKAIDVEADRLNCRIDFTTAIGQDHVVANLPVAYEWSDNQDAGGEITLLAGGTEMDPTTYKVVIFREGSVNRVAIYSVDPLASDLVAFLANTRYTLKIRRAS